MNKFKIGTLSFVFLNSLSFANTNIPVNLYCSPTVYCKNNDCKLSAPSPFNVRSSLSNPGAPNGTFYFVQANTAGGEFGGNCIYVNNYNGGGIIGYYLNPSVINAGANRTITPVTTTTWYHQGSYNWQCVGRSPNDAYKCSWNLLGND
jgi:hypothetical protein